MRKFKPGFTVGNNSARAAIRSARAARTASSPSPIVGLLLEAIDKAIWRSTGDSPAGGGMTGANRAATEGGSGSVDEGFFWSAGPSGAGITTWAGTTADLFSANGFFQTAVTVGACLDCALKGLSCGTGCSAWKREHPEANATMAPSASAVRRCRFGTINLAIRCVMATGIRSLEANLHCSQEKNYLRCADVGIVGEDGSGGTGRASQ